MHATWLPMKDLYVPDGHSTQASAVWYHPAEHRQSSAVAAPANDVLPTAHATQSCVPSKSLYVPVAQSSHEKPVRPGRQVHVLSSDVCPWAHGVTRPKYALRSSALARMFAAAGLGPPTISASTSVVTT